MYSFKFSCLCTFTNISVFHFFLCVTSILTYPRFCSQLYWNHGPKTGVMNAWRLAYRVASFHCGYYVQSLVNSAFRAAPFIPARSIRCIPRLQSYLRLCPKTAETKVATTTTLRVGRVSPSVNSRNRNGVFSAFKNQMAQLIAHFKCFANSVRWNVNIIWANLNFYAVSSIPLTKHLFFIL